MAINISCACTACYLSILIIIEAPYESAPLHGASYFKTPARSRETNETDSMKLTILRSASADVVLCDSMTCCIQAHSSDQRYRHQSMCIETNSSQTFMWVMAVLHTYLEIPGGTCYISCLCSQLGSCWGVSGQPLPDPERSWGDSFALAFHDLPQASKRQQLLKALVLLPCLYACTTAGGSCVSNLIMI